MDLASSPQPQCSHTIATSSLPDPEPPFVIHKKRSRTVSPESSTHAQKKLNDEVATLRQENMQLRAIIRSIRECTELIQA